MLSIAKKRILYKPFGRGRYMRLQKEWTRLYKGKAQMLRELGTREPIKQVIV
jgi:hypothetical protein